MSELDAEDLLRRLGLAIKRINALEAENGRLREALDIISNPGVQYPWAECARIARAALAQQPSPAQDKEQP